MSERINWTCAVQVVGGPKVSAASGLDVDAYDKLHVEVAAGDEETVELQPGGTGQVQFLLVTSDHYDATLTYKVNDAAATAVKLDGQLLLLGDGGLSLLGAAPSELIINNGMAQDAIIQILIGRKATS